MNYKYFIKAAILMCVLIVFTLIISKYVDINELNKKLVFIQGNKTIFLILRWSLIFAIIIFWKTIINLLGIHFKIKSENLQRWQTMRWTIAIWLIIFELLINDNIIVTIMQKI
jgi:hypothetical protein